MCLSNSELQESDAVSIAPFLFYAFIYFSF